MNLLLCNWLRLSSNATGFPAKLSKDTFWDCWRGICLQKSDLSVHWSGERRVLFPIHRHWRASVKETTPCIRSLVVDEKRMRPGHWLESVLCISFSERKDSWSVKKTAVTYRKSCLLECLCISGLYRGYRNMVLLWSPYGIGQTIIFSCCGLFFFFFFFFLA